MITGMPQPLEKESWASYLSSEQPENLQSVLAELTEGELQNLIYDWGFWGRPDQLTPPGNWYIWLLLAGRGFGKTRTGAEWVRSKIESSACSRMALVAPTVADCRDVIVQGESGILSISPPWNYPKYEPSKRRVTWPNGAIATLYSAEEPDRLRGPQHDGAWCDELAAWKYLESWDMLMFGLRLGSNPQVVVTTTPRPLQIIRDLMKDSNCVITRGSTYANLGNLAPSFFKRIIKKYEGTRLGRQELQAEILDDLQGALWKRSRIEELRVANHPVEMRRIVVSIDPAVTNEADSDETGITVAGVATDNHAYVIDDRSGRYSPEEWADIAYTMYKLYNADRIVAEVNNGGDLVETVLRARRSSVSYKSVHASRGKRARAEPIAALYEKGWVHHVGSFPVLEDQMCNFTQLGYEGPGSPDRADSLVWALTELLVDDADVMTDIGASDIISVESFSKWNLGSAR